jgi:membrane protein
MERTHEHGRDATTPTDIPARGWKDVLARTMASVKADQVPVLAAGVAFFALLALAPAMVALVSLYGLVADPADVDRHVTDALGAAPESARELVSDQLEAAVERSGAAAGLGVAVALALALWSASAGMKHLIGALNTVYDEHETRGFLKLRGLALAFTVGAVLFLTVASAVVALLPALLSDTALGDASRIAISILRFPALAVGMLIALAVAYRFGPDRDDPQWRWVSPGAVVAAVLWLVGSALFSVYTANFGSYDETYGSIGGVVVAMLWLLLSAYVVLLGAELNVELERQTAEDTTVGDPMPRGLREAHGADTVGPTAEQVKAEKEARKDGDREHSSATR